jgi:hypothetical protein
VTIAHFRRLLHPEAHGSLEDSTPHRQLGILPAQPQQLGFRAPAAHQLTVVGAADQQAVNPSPMVVRSWTKARNLHRSFD